MRPVSAGKVTARAALAAHNSATKTTNTPAILPEKKEGGKPAVISVPSGSDDAFHLSEFYLGWGLCTLIRGEFRHRLLPGECRLCPERCREGAQRQVKSTYCVDVITPRNGNAVLRAFKLRLQCQKICVGLQVGIILLHRQQSAEYAGQLVLRILKRLELGGIGKI